MATPTQQQQAWRGREGDFEDELMKNQLYNNAVVTRLAKYLRPYKGIVLMSFLSIMIYNLVNVLIPVFIKVAIDDYIIPGDLGGLNYLAIGFGLLLVVHLAANYIHQIMVAKGGQLMLRDLRADLFDHLQRQSMTFHNQYKVGQIMSRVQNDVYSLSEFMSLMVFSLSDILGLFAIIVTMFILDWQLALWTLASVPALILIVLIWQRYARKTFLRVRFWISRVNGALQENLAGVRVVQSMNRQDSNIDSFDHLNSSHLNSQIKASKLSASLMPVVESFTGLALAAVVVFGGQMVLRGEIEPGHLVAFAVFVHRFFDPIRQLTMQFTQMQRAMASGTRIFELLDVPVELKDKDGAVAIPPITGAVEYENVQFSYISGRPVLTDINLFIKPGEVVALVGPTGAGKTTMAGVLARFFDVGDGRITIDGHDIRDVTRASVAQQMGMVLQEPFLFSGTILDNIRYSHEEATREKVEEAAKAVGIHDYITSLPGAYDTMLEERGGNLSIGQRQLISFARALVADPKILILDEATASVDTETEQLIQAALNRLLANRTALIIAHRLSTVRNADKIVALEHGHIMEIGSHDELMALNGTYAQHYAKYQQASSKAFGNGNDPDSLLA
jgi:ATP-binding cassette subfamily B multidrug efflux pump